MKTPPDRDELLNEVLAEELRATSLERTLSAVRRQRRMHHALRGASLLAVVGIGAAVLLHQPKPAPGPVAKSNSSQSGPSTPTVPTVPGTSIRLVNDEELLSMFPDRPVALVGPPENRQFVFLDEKRNSKSPAPLHAKGLNL